MKYSYRFFIEKIKDSRGFLVGDSSLFSLASFCGGAEYAMHELAIEFYGFDMSGFEDWLVDRYGFTGCVGWLHIINCLSLGYGPESINEYENKISYMTVAEQDRAVALFYKYIVDYDGEFLISVHDEIPQLNGGFDMYRLFEGIEKRTAMYVGGFGVTSLRAYYRGAEFILGEFNVTKVGPDWCEFRSWLGNKFDVDDSTLDWHDIVACISISSEFLSHEKTRDLRLELTAEQHRKSTDLFFVLMREYSESV